MAASTEVLQGTLDLLILKTVALEPMHGWGIAQRIQQVSREMLQIQQGSLYPALYRLERKGLIRAEWGASDNNRRAKYYSLTKTGRQQLEKELADWERMSSAAVPITKRVGTRRGSISTWSLPWHKNLMLMWTCMPTSPMRRPILDLRPRPTLRKKPLTQAIRDGFLWVMLRALPLLILRNSSQSSNYCARRIFPLSPCQRQTFISVDARI